MSYNIPSRVMKHVSKLEATVTLADLSAKQKIMLINYVKTGVIRTGGISGVIARYIRVENGKQVVWVHGDGIHFHNINDQEVFDNLTAALTLTRMNGEEVSRFSYSASDPYVKIGDSRSDLKTVQRTKPPNFYIYCTSLGKNFKLSKLPDTLTIDPDDKFVVDVMKVI